MSTLDGTASILFVGLLAAIFIICGGTLAIVGFILLTLLSIFIFMVWLANKLK